MARILTGIQSSGSPTSGNPHLGNILGAIIPAITLSKSSANESIFFIADMHSLTTLKNAEQRRNNVRAVAAAWLAFGFDTDRNILFRQSDVAMVTELTWYLSCFTPYPMLANAHSFKDKADRLADVNAGLFTYPVLMAADILLYDTNFVPVGKDQVQHVEITRDIAKAFNNQYGKEILVMPEVKVDETVMVVPGLDGQKMSKTYGNTIDIFQDDKALKKNIMAIVTDSTPLEKPKNPDADTVFKLYSLLGTDDQTEDLREKYLAGGFGYGHAKTALYELVLEVFRHPRAEFNRLMADPAALEAQLKKGADKARGIAFNTLDRVREATGF